MPALRSPLQSLLVSCLLAGAGFATAQDFDAATIYTAREIVTLDPARPRVEALAIAGDRIVATGSIAQIRESLVGKTLRVDESFEDKVLVPGLINQHEHAWLATLLFMTEILSIEDWALPTKTVTRATDSQDYLARLRAAVTGHSDASEVFYTWGYHNLFHGEMNRRMLDEISTTVPIVVMQRSLHELIFNTAALEFFDINQGTIDAAPAAAQAQTNLEEGHFWEQGQGIVIPVTFQDLFKPERYLPALEQIEDYWHAAGSTLIAEPGGIVSPALIAAQNQVLGDVDTPFRMYYMVDGRSFVRGFPEDRVIAESEKLFVAAEGMTAFLPRQVKLFADGAMFSQLMQMRDGYLDGHHGEWLMEPEEFAKAFQIYWDAGYQIHVHQNGDAGLDMVLDNLAENMSRNPRRDHRTVIVHFGFSRPDQVDRLASLGAIVSANPFYPIILADRYSEVGIGPERAQEMVRLGDVERAGVSFSLHSDTPMASGQPLRLMSNAVNRITVNGNLAGPEQRIDAAAALRAVTLAAAYSLGMEDEVGSLEVGKLANITVLEDNPLSVPSEAIGDIGIWGTVHEGRILPIR